MISLPIVWQRLVSADGRTCDRCGGTHRELERAIAVLTEALRPLGIETTLETRELSEESFAANPSASNRIWILGKPLEAWLAAGVGSSQCCSVCGDSECRTVEVRGSTFEVIPERLVVRAGLLAAAELLDDARPSESAPDQPVRP